MANKYRVSQNEKVFGHFYAHSPSEAVSKAYEKVGQYYDFDLTKEFFVKYKNKTSIYKKGAEV